MAETVNLNYEYSSLYANGGKLIIYNQGDQAVTLTSITFTSNVTFKDKPWGTLWGWQSMMNSAVDEDGINTTYTINENPVIIINAQSFADLNYNIQPSALGGPLSPYNLVMDPTDITVTLADSNIPIHLKIKDACTGEACRAPGSGKRIMGYYPNWAYWRIPSYTASKLPFDKINTIGYAFAIFDKNGNISLYDKESDAVNIPIISEARKRYPYLNASLAFGGWSWASTPPGWQCTSGASPNGPALCFSQMAENPKSLANFVHKAMLAMKELHFNGIDIDWEYPLTPDDVKNYLTLLNALHVALVEQGKHDHQTYYLTIAVSAGIDKINAITPTQWKMIADTVDYVDVMTYDFHGDWDAGSVSSDFMSAMQLDPKNDPSISDNTLGKYTVVDAMNAYLERGVPAKKLVLGIPLYGRMVQIDSKGSTFGLYRTIVGTPEGEWDNLQSDLTGMIDYQCIVDKTTCGNHYIFPKLTLVDPNKNRLGQYAHTPWGYSNDFFVTYDDAKSALYKAQWVIDNQFAGVMLWDLTGDFNDTDPRSIVYVIDQLFGKIPK